MKLSKLGMAIPRHNASDRILPGAQVSADWFAHQLKQDPRRVQDPEGPDGGDVGGQDVRGVDPHPEKLDLEDALEVAGEDGPEVGFGQAFPDVLQGRLRLRELDDDVEELLAIPGLVTNSILLAFSPSTIGVKKCVFNKRVKLFLVHFATMYWLQKIRKTKFSP